MKDQCQTAEDECTELNLKIQGLEDTISNLNDCLSDLQAQVHEPKRKKANHIPEAEDPPSTSLTRNSFIDTLASMASGFIQLPIYDFSEYFSWICDRGTVQSIQRTVYFVDKQMCSSSSLIGSSLVHGLLPPIPKDCDADV
jgi:hypothetical protein